MIVLGIALAVLCVRIHRRDVNERLVYVSDVALLIVLRLAVSGVVALAQGFGGAEAIVGIAYERWGARTLPASFVRAAAVALLLWALGWVVGRILPSSEKAIGTGDIQLYFACCLFLDASECIALVYASALAGAFLAVVAKVKRNEGAFPFAPAIVWPFFALALT